MKKTLAIVLALAMALSMFASMAYVLNPGAGSLVTAPTDNALVITDFFVTDDAALVKGAAVYTDLVDNTDGALYIAKNEIIRLALTFDVLNPAVIANAVKEIGAPDQYEIDFNSKTVDLSLSKYAGMQALRLPFAAALVNAIETKVNADGQGAQYNALTNQLDLTIDVYNTVGNFGDFSAVGVAVNPAFVSDAKPVAKKSFAFIFSGITKGEITEKGAVTASMNYAGDDDFADGYVVKTVNGRTYVIVKTADVAHDTVTTGLDANYYALNKAGYQVALIAYDNVDAEWDINFIGQLDTEVVTYNNVNFGALYGKDVEGVGQSLGLEVFAVKAGTNPRAKNDAAGVAADIAAYLATAPAKEAAFKTILTDGTVKYVKAPNGAAAFTAEEMALFNTALADLGLSTDINYTYKITDGLFSSVGAYAVVLTAEYNNGVVAPIEAEDEADVLEGTEDEEIVEDEVVEEEIVEDEIVEDVVVPTTGDATASVVLAAAAIMAAAALAFVMKKVRD